MDVYKELKGLSDRYSKLRLLFVQFYEYGTPLLKGGDISGVEVGSLTGQRHFDVSLAGTRARFAFTFDAADFRGRVTCFRVEPGTPEVLEPVGHFTFNGEGDTGMKVPDGSRAGEAGDPLLVSMDAHACYLLAELLHKALLFPTPATPKPR